MGAGIDSKQRQREDEIIAMRVGGWAAGNARCRMLLYEAACLR